MNLRTDLASIASASLLLVSLWGAGPLTAAQQAGLPPGSTWRYLRPGNTGIQGDFCEAVWVGPDDDPIIAGYNPWWEDGGFARFVQAENRWENWSTVDYPEIGPRSIVGGARVHDIAEDADGKLWMATWIGLLEFDPAVGAASLKRWDSGNSPHPGSRTMDVDVAPDGSIWMVTLASGPLGGGLLRYRPSTGEWSYWGYNVGGNNWPSGIPSGDRVVAQPKPGGGYVVWFQGWGRIVTFDSDTETFTEQPITGTPGEVVGLVGGHSVDDVGNLWAWRTAPSGGLNRLLEIRTPEGSWTSPPQIGGVGGKAFRAFGAGQAVAIGGSGDVWRFDGSAWQSLGIWRSGGFNYDVAIDSAGNVWAVGKSGAARRDATTGAWQRYRVTNTSMLDYFPRDLAFGGAGGVWMTGNAGPGFGGFQHFDDTRWFNLNDFTYGLGGPWGFPSDNSDAVAVRASGDVVVNPTFNGLHQWNGLDYVDLLGMGTSDGLVEDSLGRLWSLGNYYSLAYHDGAGWIPVDIDGWGANIQNDPERPGTIWAVANFEVVRTDGTYRFSRQSVDFPELSPVSDLFTTVAADAKGVAWVGSTDGLFRLDSTNGTYEWFHPSNSAIPGDQISPMAVSPDGRVWFTNFGTRSTWPDSGLGWFDGTTFGYVTRGTVPGGLPHAQIADMEVRPVPGGYELWLACTSEGIGILNVPLRAGPRVKRVNQLPGESTR